MTRRGFIAGATAMAAGLAMPGVVKSAAAARSTIFSNSTDEEEEMYKEMFLGLVQSPEAGGRLDLVSDAVLNVRPCLMDFWKWILNPQHTSTVNSNATVSVNFPNCKSIGTTSFGNVFKDCGLVSVSLPELEHSYGTYNFSYNLCTEISLPKLQNFNNHEFSYSATLKVLRLPSVTSKSGNYFVYNCSALENVYLPQMTLAQLGGASYIAQQQCNSAAVFHLQDGDYDYQGSPLT
jgi:hypothetical protein